MKFKEKGLVFTNFELVLTKLGLTNNHNIWMVGDNPATDIIGGKSIGAVTFQRIQTVSDSGSGEFMPDFTFTNFKDFHTLVISSIDSQQI